MSAPSRTLSPDDLNEPEFLERERELKQLRDLYQTARDGHKRCAIIAGAAGVGKTRLFKRFKEQEVSKSQPFFTADFTVEVEGPEVRARPVLLMLASLVKKFGKLPKEVTESDALIEIDLGTMEFILANFRGEPDEDVLGNVHGTEDQFWSAMVQLIVEHARRRPVNLLFEALNKADLSSSRFVEFFMQVPEERGAHIFAAATYDDEDDSMGNHFGKAYARVRRADPVEVVRVMPLLSRSVPSFLTSVVGRLQADDKVYDEAFKLTKGNPELLRAFVHGLAEKGVILRQGTGWAIDSERAEISALPKEIEDKLIAGAKRLGKKHRDAIEWAAVIAGVAGEFDMEQVVTLTGVGGAHLGFVVTDMTRDRYWDEVEEHKPRRFHFPSSRVRKAVYENIKEKTRKKMHTRVAADLEKRDPAPAAHLAAHYAAAENTKKEHVWALQAARDAYRQAQWLACQKHVDRVLELLKEQKKPNPAELAEAYTWQARAYRRRRQLFKADDAVKEGLRQAALGKDAFAAELKAEHALLKTARRDFTAFDAVKQCIDGGGDVARNPELLVTMANFLRLRNRPKQAAEWLASVQPDDPDYLPAEGMHQLTEGRLKFLQGKWAKCERALSRAEEVFREQRAFGLLAQTLHALAELRDVQGRIPEALRLVTSGTQYAEDYQDAGIEARLRALLARLLQKHGDGEEGYRELKTARKLAKKGGVERIIALVNLETCRFYVHLKSFERGLESGRKALETFENIKERWGGAGCYHALGRLYLRAGNLQQAHKYFKYAVEYYRDLGATWMGAFIAPQWANVASKAGKASRQARLLKEGLEFATKYEMPEARALVLLEMGRMSTNPAEAMEWSREAHDLLRQAGNRMEAKRARVLYKREKTATLSLEDNPEGDDDDL